MLSESLTIESPERRSFVIKKPSLQNFNHYTGVEVVELTSGEFLMQKEC